MKERLSPDLQSILWDDEEILLVVRGGYGAVREYFLCTGSRYITARQLGKRMACTLFDRDRELWMEIRPNKRGTDLIISSSDTLERIRGLSSWDVNTLKATFGIEEGAYEEVVPRPDAMVKLFEGSPGSTLAEGEPRPGHHTLYIISAILFVLLAYECGRLISPLPGQDGLIAWQFLGAAALVTAILVKSSLQLACFLSLAPPALVLGISRAAPGIVWKPDTNVLGLVAAGGILIWLLAVTLREYFRELGDGRALPAPTSALAVSCVSIVVMLLLTIHVRLNLSPWDRRVFVRSVYFKPPRCRLAVWDETPDRLVAFDNRHLLAVALQGGRGGSWEFWTHSKTSPDEVDVIGRFAEGLLVRAEQACVAAFDMQTGKDRWSFNVRRPVGRGEIVADLQVLPRVDQVRVLLATGSIVLLDLQTGEVRWKRPFPGFGRFSALNPRFVPGPSDYVIVEWPGRALAVLRAASGRNLWSVEVPPGFRGAACSGAIVAFSEGKKLRGLSLETGRQGWQVPFSGTALARVFRLPTGLLAMPTVDGHVGLTIVDPLSGQHHGRADIVGADAATLDFSCATDGIISWETGLWRYRAEHDGSGYVLCLAGPTNAVRLATAPVVSDGCLYLTTQSGFVWCFDDASGLLKWRYRTRGIAAVGGLTATRRGPLVLTTTGLLYAFRR